MAPIGSLQTYHSQEHQIVPQASSCISLGSLKYPLNFPFSHQVTDQLSLASLNLPFTIMVSICEALPMTIMVSICKALWLFQANKGSIQ